MNDSIDIVIFSGIILCFVFIPVMEPVLTKLFRRVHQTRFDRCTDVEVERCSGCNGVVGLSVENVLQMEIDTGDRCPYCKCLIEHSKH